MFKDVKITDFDEAVKSGMIEYVDESVYDTYLEKVMEQQVNPGVCKGADLKVVYTPLNGTGNKLVRKVLGKIGVNDVVVVPEQELPEKVLSFVKKNSLTFSLQLILTLTV